METQISTHKPNYNFTSEIVDVDEQEKVFEELLKLWLYNQISYEKLIENMPDKYISKWKRLLKLLYHYSF